MGRIIAIDYGKKRTGLAVSDPLKMIAGGLDTIDSHLVIPFLKNYQKNELVELFVLGEPRRLDNTPSENYNRVLIFREKLIKAFPGIEVVMMDERFTSVLAHQTLATAGMKKAKRTNPGLIDEISATIILQSYLESVR